MRRNVVPAPTIVERAECRGQDFPDYSPPLFSCAPLRRWFPAPLLRRHRLRGRRRRFAALGGDRELLN